MPRADLRSMREHHHMSAIHPNSLSAACAALLAPLALAQTDINATMQHGGVTRSYIVRLPPGFSAEDRAPLVVALHPSVSTGADFKATSGWDGVSNTHGLVVVYPTGGQPVGTNGKFAWNDWSFSGAAPDDLSFLDANAGAAGVQHFSFIGLLAGAANPAGGQIGYRYVTLADGVHTIIDGNIQNAGGAVDFQIDLLGHITLDAGDFALGGP